MRSGAGAPGTVLSNENMPMMNSSLLPLVQPLEENMNSLQLGAEHSSKQQTFGRQAHLSQKLQGISAIHTNEANMMTLDT